MNTHGHRRAFRALVDLFNKCVAGVYTAGKIAKLVSKLLISLIRWAARIFVRAATPVVTNPYFYVISGIISGMAYITYQAKRLIDSFTEGFNSKVPKQQLLTTDEIFQQCFKQMNETIFFDFQHKREKHYVESFVHLLQPDAQYRVLEALKLKDEVIASLKTDFQMLRDDSKAVATLPMTPNRDERIQLFAESMSQIICRANPTDIQYKLTVDEEPPEGSIEWAYRLGENVNAVQEGIRTGASTASTGLATVLAVGVAYFTFKMSRKILPPILDATGNMVNAVAKKMKGKPQESSSDDDIEPEDEQEFKRRVRLNVELFELSEEGQERVRTGRVSYADAMKREIETYVRGEIENRLDKIEQFNKRFESFL